jgi:hypothetical protein
MGFTLFFLVYGSKAILPTDLEYGSPRVKAYNEQSDDVARENALDQLEEARDIALLHSAMYQQNLTLPRQTHSQTKSQHRRLGASAKPNQQGTT